MIVKLSQRVLFNRITSGMLSILLVVGTVLNPVTMLPAFATASFVKLNYENHDKNAVELYVQAEEVNYKPGDEMELTLYVQNNSEEALSGVGLSWNGDEDAFEEAEFIGYEELEAELNDKGNVVNLNLEAGEIVSLGFVGTLADDLEDLNRGEISFFYGAETESGTNVTDRTNFEFTVGLFNELSMEFTDGNELALGETSTIDVKLSLNDLGYYYEAGVEEEEIVEVATDSNTIVATDSNTEIVTASDSDAELATDSNSEEEDTEVATDSNTEDDVEVASDSDSEEEEDIEEEYVFEITDIELNMDTYGAKFKNAKVKHATVADGKAEVEATIEFEMDDDAELGEYFGTLQAAITSDKKVYNAEIGFQYEVVDELITTGFKKYGLFTAELENFTVNVQVPKGAFDEKVELSVTELATDSEEYKEAEEAMANHDRQYDGMMALDICFLNEDGEEVEPKEGCNVQVSIEMNAQVLPEGTDTESLMVHHIAETTTDSVQTEVVVEDVADTADATEGLVEMKEDTEVPVVAAEFKVEGFSTFTITWNNITTPLVMYMIDESGNEIGQVDDKKIYSAMTISENAPSISGYSYSKAVVASSAQVANSNGTEIQRVRYNNTWQYHTSTSGTNNWRSIAPNYVYLIYSKFNLNTVPGVAVPNVTVNMFNYDSGINNDSNAINNFKFVNGRGSYAEDGGQYSANGGGTPTMRTTLVNGYPAVTGSGNTSMAYLFNPAGEYHVGTAVDGGFLFQKDENGNYYYDAALNAAYFDESTNQFTLYNGVVRPNYPDDAYWNETDFYNLVNYFPFNELTEQTVIIDNPTKLSGVKTTEINSSTKLDLWFGMTVEFEFLMPEDGLVNGEPMVFEFLGDDDVFVYIDDRLVLDIGGTHGALSGTIDFSTGSVFYQNSNNESGINTNLRTLFTNHTYNGEAVALNGNTFADYTVHKLKFFYLERGGNISYCKLKYNLPTLPEGSLRIEKELTHTDSASAEMKSYIENSVDYKFKVVKADGTLYLPSNKDGVSNEYKVYEGDVLKETRTLGSDGIITLKAGQYALFENMVQYDEDGSLAPGSIETYYVQEIMEGEITGQYEEILYTVNGNGGTHETEDGDVTGFNTFASTAITNDQSQYVLFRNKVDLNKLSILNVTKEIAPGSAEEIYEKTFKFKIELGQDEDDLAPIAAGTKYQVSDSSGTVVKEALEGGYITLTDGQTARLVEGILAGTHYRVSEDIDGDYKATYMGTIESSDTQTIGSTPTATSAGVTGDFTPGDTVHVTVTNSDYDFITELPISKYTIGFEEVSSVSTFEFEVVPCDANGIAYSTATSYVGSTITVPKENADDAAPITNTISLGGRTDKFVTGDIYYFKVTEKAETAEPNDTEKESMIQFDDTVYIVGVNVTANNATIASVKKDGTAIDTTSTLAFVNSYNNTTTITLDKVVAGNFGDVAKEFTFKVSVDGTELSTTYKLSHSTPVITISDIPINAKVVITELDNKGYEVAATVTNTATESLSGSVLTFIASDKAGHNVVFTNTKNAVIDTGISMDTLPYILILLAVIGGIAFVVIRKRKDDDLD